MEREYKLCLASMLMLLLVLFGLCAKAAAESTVSFQEKPIIVCTTNVLGSIVKELMGDAVEVTVLVNPSLCPADYDIKPGDIYALGRAKVLFYHDIPGEKPWLGSLIEAAGNEQLRRVKVPGTYNTPDGAKNCIKIIAGNLSQIFGVDLSGKMNDMLSEIDSVANQIRGEAQSLGVGDFKVICMNWQKTFVEWVGFKVVATYGPPEQLSAGDIEGLISKAREEKVALIIDNLQVSAEFGASIASEVGAVHVVLTNFPGAVPRTGSLAEMFRYNVDLLFNALRRWKLMKETEVELEALKLQVENLRSELGSLLAENEGLKNQITVYQAAIGVIAVIAVIELTMLLARRRPS
ncbi:MAG: zinc ABC transporter substrate-binding protein [Candidatus Bathyarchaeia archaeon]